MNRRLAHTGLLSLLAIGLLSAGALAQVKPTPAAAVTGADGLGPANPAMISFAEQRGSLLYRLDRAAWVASDAFQAVWRDQPGVTPRGWVVEETGDQRLVTFFGNRGNELVALARFAERNGRVTTRQHRLSEADTVLTGNQRALASAHFRAGVFAGSPAGRRAGVVPCAARPFNTIVVASTDGNGSHDVYLMTPWVENHVYPMGGHYRLKVPVTGEAMLDRTFTNSCLNVQSGVPGRRDLRPEALVVTHVLDPQPTEIHVFAAQTLNVPVMVAIDGQVFRVTRDGIRLSQ
ncbi:MAG: hypothetical protein MUF14_00560 [Hyphomonadaceae bacterium]|jgi:hypothetical protein|nr:hypothetical protein [Hyphomonadaceae bacterium]